MTYSDSITELATQVTGLLATGPPSPYAEPLPADRAAVVLTARDSVVAATRGLTGALLGRYASTTQGLHVEDTVNQPALVMHSVLCTMPNTYQGERSSSDLLTGDATSWATAGRAATSLEGYLRRVRRLPMDDRATALRDVAVVASAIPDLDADLAGQLPPDHPARAPLADSTPHALLRIVSHQLRQTRPDGDSQYARKLDPERVTVGVLRIPRDIPDGLRQLVALVECNGPRLAAADARAVIRVVATGIDVIQPAGPAPAGYPDWLSGLRDAPPALRMAATTPMATITPRDPAISVVGIEIHNQLRQLARKPDPAVADHWVPAAAQLSDALADCLVAAGRNGLLFVRPDDDVRGLKADDFWMPLPRIHAERNPVVGAIRQASDALNRTAANRPTPAVVATGAERRWTNILTANQEALRRLENAVQHRVRSAATSASVASRAHASTSTHRRAGRPSR